MILKPENIRKIASGQGDNNKTGCLLGYPYFKENYKIIAIDLSKRQTLDFDPRAIQQINFTANLDRLENTSISFITEEAKETFLRLFTRNFKSIVNMLQNEIPLNNLVLSI